MLTLCSCLCPQSLADRYPRSSGSSVMLWPTSGSPGTHGIERGRNHPVTPLDGMISGYDYDYDYIYIYIYIDVHTCICIYIYVYISLGGSRN